MTPPGGHVADSHDRIRVQGARENKLKDVSLEIPRRRLTEVTGVSGSGKSSLVFGTTATESQRINETPAELVTARSTLTGRHLAALVGAASKGG